MKSLFIALVFQPYGFPYLAHHEDYTNQKKVGTLSDYHKDNQVYYDCKKKTPIFMKKAINR